MRKPRDYNAELKALDEKAMQLKQKRIIQLGELVVACGADAMSPEQLASALLGLRDADTKTAEVWRQRDAAFFQRAPRKPAGGHDHLPRSTDADAGRAPSA